MCSHAPLAGHETDPELHEYRLVGVVKSQLTGCSAAGSGRRFQSAESRTASRKGADWYLMYENTGFACQREPESV